MKTLLLIGALLVSGGAYAQSSSIADQTSQSQSVAQGTIQFSQTPEHTTETIRNVSAPVLGAYASSFSQMNCGQTAQGGFAVAGFSGVFGASKDSHTCVLEVAAAEMVRQSTVTPDPTESLALRHAANGVRCQISEEVYDAMQDAGFECKRKPAGMQ
jgi:hypothetical protein